MLRILSVLLFCLGIFCLAQSNAQVPMTGAGLGVPGGIATFQGLGDVVPGAKAFWGSQAYTAALRGNAVMNVCNSTGGVDVGCADLLTDSSTGKLVPATIATITCPGNANCTVKIWYDQSGQTNCGGQACDMTQGTVASRPTLTASALGGTGCPTIAAATAPNMTTTFGSGGFTLAQPITISAVGERTAATTQFGAFVDDNTSQVQAGFNTAANGAYLFAGSTVPTATANDNAFHAMQFIVNGASGSFYIDGSSTAASTGSNTMSSTVLQLNGNTGFTGTVCEMAIYGADETSNASAMNSNQHGALRWNF